MCCGVHTDHGGEVSLMAFDQDSGNDPSVRVSNTTPPPPTGLPPPSLSSFRSFNIPPSSNCVLNFGIGLLAVAVSTFSIFGFCRPFCFDVCWIRM